MSMNGSTKRAKTRLKQVKSIRDLRDWWNTVVDVKVKAIVITTILACFTIVGFQYQVNALTADRLDTACQIRIESRTDLRETLFAMVDLHDLFEGEPYPEGAKKYTENRIDLINENWPLITEKDCA